MYLPNAQVPDAIQALNVKLTPLAWVIKTRVNPTDFARADREQLRQVSGLPVSDVRTMDETVSRSTSRERFHMLLMTVFGGVSLLLAAIGIYGLMAYSVEQRTQEIGIRMALGAEVSDVRGMVIKQGVLLALAGIVLALAPRCVSETIGELCFRRHCVGSGGVRDDTGCLGSGCGTVAVWWPAQRATEVDPATALRQS